MQTHGTRTILVRRSDDRAKAALAVAYLLAFAVGVPVELAAALLLTPGPTRPPERGADPLQVADTSAGDTAGVADAQPGP